MLGHQSKQTSKLLAELFGDLFINDTTTAVIASTDLSHYHSSDRAEKIDGKLIETILNRTSDKFYEQIIVRNAEACGFGGIVTLMALKDKLKNNGFAILKYTHSGFTSGDFSQVVGYLSAALAQKD